ncbi:PEP-CTERM sorting domain-containing protein [Nitrogeniibacter aestuarii]|uniref:PEP-CTERM sorting domain-containing protein n=1 Tax=Nitrogeniibacter aestuarii TaxID=2815343 RepID=UPI001D118EEE|nr:PEP-CTERM sorting domain-containing protein [Nitrogeniibacter aestuarii]
MKQWMLMGVLAVSGLGAHAADNLLVNGGFEDGLLGWESMGNAAIRTADPLAYEGDNYLYGDSTSLYSVWQDIDLLGAGFSAEAIDSGQLIVSFGGFQSGWHTQTDHGYITLALVSDEPDEIGGFQLTPFYSNNTWVEQSGEGQILPGTRTIHFEFVGIRDDGSNNDAYLDAAFLTVSAVPEPEALGMFLAGLGVVAAGRRRLK